MLTPCLKILSMIKRLRVGLSPPRQAFPETAPLWIYSKALVPSWLGGVMRLKRSRVRAPSVFLSGNNLGKVVWKGNKPTVRTRYSTLQPSDTKLVISETFQLNSLYNIGKTGIDTTKQTIMKNSNTLWHEINAQN